ncbi:MAG: hypothetical protein C0448_09140 [Sphingobacteriaceae bacterium]|nr:hypothetical protein [Sphingobacteriaceae bacterium]
MKKKLLPIGVFLLAASVNAQEVISSQGNSYSNATHTIDYTIGEPVTATVSNGVNDLTQGFHQTNLTITSVEDLDANISVNLFPNPTSEFVNLTVDKYEDLTLRLFDATGKLIKELSLKQSLTSVKVSEYADGTYLLTLTHKEDKKIKTFKIIKN